MILKAFKFAWEKAAKKDWDSVYIAMDIHGTIIKPNYKYGDIPKEFYPYAKETLQEMSKRKDMKLYLYTCSHPEELEQYVEFFKSHDINFRFTNRNPEVVSQGYGCYDAKPYFDILFEDKCGFDAESDWDILSQALDTLIELPLHSSLKNVKISISNTRNEFLYDEKPDHYILRKLEKEDVKSLN